MQIAYFAVALVFASYAASACSLTSATQRRELQFVPQGNNQGPFRPNAPAQWLPHGLNLPNEAVPIAAEAQPADPTTAANDESDPTTLAAVPPSTADAVAPSATTTGEIAPGQPTIMVIVPDFLAAGSGWSSYSGDVGETKTPLTAGPAQDTEKPSSSAASPRHSRLAAAAVAMSMAAAALALSANE